MINQDPIMTQRLPGDYAPTELLQASLQKWWLVTLLVFFGGLAGWLLFLIQPPNYEAKVSVLVNVDFSDTGALTQFEEDAMMDAVGGVFKANDVIQRTLTKAEKEDIHFDIQDFKRISFVERRLGTWEMRVQHRSPEVAMQLANLWLKEGTNAFNSAYRHAVTANHLQQYTELLEGCMSKSVIAEPVSALCASSDRAAVQKEIQEVAKTLATERKASRGILTAALLGTSESSPLPDRPVEAGRGGYILAGSLLGFLGGFILCQFPFRFGKR